MIEGIDRIQLELQQLHEANEGNLRHDKTPLGLCSIIRQLSLASEITRGVYSMMKDEINRQEELQDHQYDFIGDKARGQGLFLWKPVDFKSRNKFLENLKKRYIE